MTHIRVNGLEGHYTIKRLNKLPKRGNSNWLYTLKEDNLAIFYIWTLDNEYEKISISDSLSFATSIQAGTNISITGTGTSTDPYTVVAISETAAETPVTPTGNIDSTNVQDALVELQTDIDTLNVQSDWDQTNNIEIDYIQNKPTNTSDFTNDGSDGTSLYIQDDDPILPRIVSGIVDNNTAIATFIRNDSTSFSVDFSSLVGGSSTVDNSFSSSSTNALENQVINQEILNVKGSLQNNRNVALSNNIIENLTSRTDDGTNLTDASSVVYDRDIIWAQIGGQNYLLIKLDELDTSSMKNMIELPNQQVWISTYNQILVPYQTGTLVEYENVLKTLVDTNTVPLTGLDSNYTAYPIVDYVGRSSNKISSASKTQVFVTFALVKVNNGGSTNTQEGTWTPILQTSSGNTSIYGSNSSIGNYYINDKIMHFNISINRPFQNSVPSASNNSFVITLPSTFTYDTSFGNTALSVARIDVKNFPPEEVFAFVVPGLSSVQLRAHSAPGSINSSFEFSNAPGVVGESILVSGSIKII